MSTYYDFIVAGGSAAGLSAALMLGRARRRVLVVDSQTPRNRFAAHMHGVLGLENTPPQDLVQTGRAEVEKYGVEFTADTITQVHQEDDGNIVIHTASEAKISCFGLILATGITDELPAIPGIAEFWGTKVLHCPYCHGYEVRDQRLGVLATSDMSTHQAELIRQWSSQVTVFTQGMSAFSPEINQRLGSRGVTIETTPVTAYDGTHMILADARRIPIDAIFTMPNPKPNDEIVSALSLAREDTPFGSFIKVDQMGRTSSPRVWAAGNVINPGANVPVSIGAGSMAGGAANFSLVAAEFDQAN